MRNVYSRVLAQATSVDDSGTLLGSPPDTYVWVIRFAAATFGSYAGYCHFGLALQLAHPVLWVCSSPAGIGFSNHAVTWFWEGRMVVPAGGSIYGYSSTGDACDVHLSGYELSST
jgi:hypothetical protein